MTPPTHLDGAKVTRFVIIDSSISPSGKTIHTIFGEEKDTDFASRLAICSYDDSSGFYLFYCDDNWKVIDDGFGDTLEEILLQAEFEYEGITTKWEVMV